LIVYSEDISAIWSSSSEVAAKYILDIPNNTSYKIQIRNIDFKYYFDLLWVEYGEDFLNKVWAIDLSYSLHKSLQERSPNCSSPCAGSETWACGDHPLGGMQCESVAPNHRDCQFIELENIEPELSDIDGSLYSLEEDIDVSSDYHKHVVGYRVASALLADGQVSFSMQKDLEIAAFILNNVSYLDELLSGDSDEVLYDEDKADELIDFLSSLKVANQTTNVLFDAIIDDLIGSVEGLAGKSISEICSELF